METLPPTSLSVELALGLDMSLQAPASLRLAIRDATGNTLGSLELEAAAGERSWVIAAGSVPGEVEIVLEARIRGVSGNAVLWSGEEELRTTAGGSAVASMELRAGGPENADVSSVAIESGASLTMLVGDTLQLPVLVIGGNPVNAVLRSEDSGIVSVDVASRSFIGETPGTTTVRVLAGLHQATAEIEVVDRLTALVLQPEEVSFSSLGESLRLTALGLGSTGLEVPLPGELEWRVEGDGSVQVDASGLVTALRNGGARVIATVRDLPNVEGDALVTVLQAARVLTAVQGRGQTGEVGETLAQAPVVRVLDALGNPVPGIEVRFHPAPGSGTVAASGSTTDSDGLASPGDWTLGAEPGVQYLTASADGVDSVIFEAEAEAGAPAQLVPVSAVLQEGRAGSAVAESPVVLVRDRLGNPLSEVEVEFRITLGDGSLLQDRPITGEAGTASPGSWTLGGTVGIQRVEARVGTLGPVSFDVDVEPGLPHSIEVLEGEDQTGTVGLDLPVAPSVQVLDSFGNSVPGTSVAFEVTGGGGSVTEGFTATDEAGVATVGSWTLGRTPGAQILQVTTGSISQLVLATAEAGDPDRIEVMAGGGQIGTVGAALPVSPSVRVQDAFGNDVPGVAVDFQVTGGGGSVTGGSTTTDAAGVATLGSWTLGETPGGQSLQVTAGGVSALVEATAEAGDPERILIMAGDSQMGRVGAALPVAPSVQLLDAFGNGVPGVAVHFEVTVGGGSVTGGSTTTDAAGVATLGSWILGETPGAQRLEVAAGGLSTLLQATAEAGDPERLIVTAGDGQTGRVGAALPTAPSVQVLDAFGNGVPGVAVAFEVTGGGGSVTGSSVTTGAAGVATLGSWTLGQTLGAQSLGVTAGGLSAVIQATAGAGDPDRVVVTAGGDQTGRVGTALPVAPSIHVQDTFGNGVPGVAVEFEVTGGGGSVTGGSTNTDAAGMATLGSWTLGQTPGVQTLRVTAGGSFAVIQATAEAGLPEQMIVTAGADQSGGLGATLPIAPTVQVLDGLGNGVPGVAVEFEVTGGGGSVTGGSTTTDGSGTSAVGSWTLGPEAGLNTLVATAGELTVTFEATAEACVIVSLSVGEVHSMSLDGSETLCISSAETTQEFVLVPANASPSPFQLRATGTGIIAATGPPAPLFVGSSPLQVNDPADIEYPVRVGEPLSSLRSRGGVTPMGAGGDGPEASIVPGVPTLGDEWTLNVARSCEGALDNRTGRVARIGSHFIIVEDLMNPANGFTPEDLDAIMAEADTLVYPTLTDHFGSPTDLDGNGRVVLFFTRAVNELVPPASSVVNPGYFETRDLFSTSSCPRSNEGEIIYLMVPDPTGAVNGNVRTVSSVRSTVIGRVAETLQSLISASRRAYVTAAPEFQEAWLDRALSAVARELVFYRAAPGLGPGMDIQLGDLTTGPNASRRVAAFNTFQNANFGRLRPWLQRADTTGAFAAEENLANQGAAWAFLRYSADRSNVAETVFWSSVVDSPLSGTENLGAAIGASVDEWYADFATGIYGDNAVAGLPESYRHQSWNFRSVFSGLGGFPLFTRSLTDGVPLNLLHARDGGGSFLRFAVPSEGTAQLELADNGAPAGPVPFRILRTR